MKLIRPTSMIRRCLERAGVGWGLRWGILNLEILAPVADAIQKAHEHGWEEGRRFERFNQKTQTEREGAEVTTEHTEDTEGREKGAEK